MRFTLGDISPCSGGMGESYGVGISYRYCKESSTLQLIDKCRNRHLLHVACSAFLSKDLQGFVELIEKSLQAQSLKLSGQTTHRIVDVIHSDKLASLIYHTVATARDCYSLKHEAYCDFTHSMRRDYQLHEAYIKFIKGTHASDHDYKGHFKARLKTLSAHTVTARSCQLPHLLQNLANIIMTDLVVQEYQSHDTHVATNLVKLSSQLDMMGLILDPDYIPKNCLITSTTRISAAT